MAAPFIGRLAHLPVAPAQASGPVAFENTGTAEAYPVWDIRGPGRNFKATSAAGETLHWTGTLAADEKLSIDTMSGTVVDDQGRNRYSELGVAPRMWTIPPGTSTGMVEYEGTSPGAYLPGQLVATNYCRSPFAGAGTATGFAAYSSGTGETGGDLFSSNTSARVAVRTNLFWNPNPTAEGGTGWSFQGGTGQVAAVSYVTGASDGPTAEVTNYLRRTVTTAATAGSSGWYYREPAGTAAAGVAGDVRRAAMWIRFSVPVSVASSISFRLGTTAIGGANIPTIMLPANTWHLSHGEATAPGTYDGAQIFPGTATILPVGATYDAAVAHFETADTWQGDSFWGAAPTRDLPGDVRYSHAYEGTAGASASTRSLQITPGATLNGRTFARRVIATPKTTGSTGWTARGWATRGNVSGKVGDKVTVAVTQRFVGPGDGQGFRLRIEFQDAAGAAIQNVDLPTTQIGASGEIVSFRNTVAAPVDFESIGWWAYQAGATNASSTPPAGSVIDATGVLISVNLPDPSIAAFDGDTPTSENGVHEWSGAKNTTPSNKLAAVLTGASRVAVSWRARKWLVI